MLLNHLQQQTLEYWMGSKAIIQYPACREDRWRYAEASYVRTLLEAAVAGLVGRVVFE